MQCFEDEDGDGEEFYFRHKDILWMMDKCPFQEVG